MVIEARTIVGAAAACAVAGAALWLFSPPANDGKTGSVEVVQMQERSWTVEVKDLGAADGSDSARTAANR